MAEVKQITQYEKMTQTPVEKLVATLAVPTIISMLISNVYNMVDTAFVGRLGTSASGAVGIVFGFMAILQAFGFLFGQGSGSILARALGSKDENRASTVASTGLFFAVSFGLLISVLSFIFLEPLIYFLGSTVTIMPYAKSYITYILLAAPFMTASFCMNNILRFEGKAFYGMIGLLTGAVLNMALDPILMFGLKLGISGAGLATAISQTIGSCILFSMFLTHKSQVRLSFQKISFDGKLFLNIVTTGLPSMVRQGLQSAGTVILNTLAAPYGDVAIAAMSIVSRISFFTFSLSLGIGQGFQPVSGFNYGAGKFSRVRKAYKFGLILSQICMCVLVSIVLLFSGSIIQIFRDDPEVIRIGTRAVRLQACAQLCMPFCTMTEMLLQSTGQRFQASILSAMKSGILFIPALLILSKVRGLSGIQEAQPLAFVLATIPTAIYAIDYFKKLPKEDRM